MSRVVTLDIPEEIYEPLKKTAEQISQSPETLAVQRLSASSSQNRHTPVTKVAPAGHEP